MGDDPLAAGDAPGRAGRGRGPRGLRLEGRPAALPPHLRPPVRSRSMTVDVDHFVEQGWVLTRSHDDVDALRRWVDEVAAWPDDGPWLHHRERSEHGPQLCRTEAFVPHHAALRALLTTGTMVEDASSLLGEPAVLYKEKINYKLPGGA